MAIKIKPLLEHYRADYDTASAELREALTKQQIRPTDFDFGSLFEACYGWEAFAAHRRDKTLSVNDMQSRSLMEAEGAVSTQAFRNISGQIVYSAVLDAYNLEEDQFIPLIPEIPTQFLEGEKLAGLSEMGDEVAVRQEADPYALAGFGEDWIFTPPLKDRGVIVPVTWEAVFADRTGLVLQRAAEVGKWSKQNRAKRAIDCVIDGNTTAHRYNWRGTTIASYNDNTGTHTWDNLAASNGLTDHLNLDTAEQLFNGLTDPYTGEPIMIEPKHLVVTKSKFRTAQRIINATQIRTTTPGFATSGNPAQATQDNPWQNAYQIITSRLLGARITAASGNATDWYLGDISKYAAYMVAEKMDVVQAPSNNTDEFERRIVAKYRVNERGAYVVRQPRAMVKCTA